MSSSNGDRPRPSVAPADVAIAARGVGKAYSIFRPAARTTRAAAVARRLRRPLGGGGRETLWALRDVTFDIGRGEVVGVVGRNGAGKSTLLKLLSHISEPTAGQIGIWGRVGSLLEVGTGFHPELTGRENVFLNGSILGMRRGEIRGQFDAIADFSGVQKFLDTPVKRYSSGMRVRLAFAVAVHLKPEILIVDEVLSVGDGDFQRRCLRKMEEVARSGRTILLVSHNMGSIQALCGRALFMQGGRLVQDGPADAVVAAYLRSIQPAAGSAADDPRDREGDGRVRVREVRIVSASSGSASSGSADAGEVGIDGVANVMGGEDVTVELPYESSVPGRTVSVLLNVYNDDGAAVCAAHTGLTRPDLAPLGRTGVLRCRLPRLPLTVGSYRLAVAVHLDGETADYLPRAAELEVVASVFHGSGAALDSRAAAFHVDHSWDHEPGVLRPGPAGG